MAVSIMVKQDREFRTRFWVPEEEDSNKLIETDRLHLLTPYSMMLSSLASCTAIVLHTYAQYHHIPLDEVELQLKYDRDYKKDCETCDQPQDYTEEIKEEIALKGKISDQERQELLLIAHACPIYKMFKNGVPIQTKLSAG